MSGAEAAGLALGVVALASLFNTCVELLDYIESGLNYTYDYELACTKIEILHERLDNWGSVSHIREQGCEHHSLREPAKRKAVGRVLFRLSTVLSDTEGLKKKYEVASTGHAHTSLTSKSDISSTRTSSWSLNLRRRTTWSVRDKAKFDRLIHDVSFLIDNLEKVTGASGLVICVDDRRLSDQPKIPGLVMDEVDEDSRSLEHMHAGKPGVLEAYIPNDRGGKERQRATKQSSSIDGKAPAICSHRQLAVMRKYSTTGQSGQCEGYVEDSAANETRQTSSYERTLIVSGKQSNKDTSIGVQGSVGEITGTCEVSGEQMNNDNCFGVKGAVNLDAIRIWQDGIAARGNAEKKDEAGR